MTHHQIDGNFRQQRIIDRRFAFLRQQVYKGQAITPRQLFGFAHLRRFIRDRQIVTVTGTLRTVTLRPRAGVPALEAELFDGSAALDVVWLGRRSIVGIEPGRRLIASGRISMSRGRRVLFNPKYELRPLGRE